MPQAEVRRYTLTYDRIEQVAKSFDVIWPAIVQARLYSIFDSDPTHLTPAQLAEEMTYTENVLMRHFAAAAALVQLNYADRSFTPALTKDELNEIMRKRSILDALDYFTGLRFQGSSASNCSRVSAAGNSANRRRRYA
jgi:hypothetical protein